MSARIYGLDPPESEPQRWAIALDRGPPAPKPGEIPAPWPRAFFCLLCDPPCTTCPLNQREAIE